ncbi:SN protein, partial [Polyodon spathula]|nr:SN protein [Polyodon spathula]
MKLALFNSNAFKSFNNTLTVSASVPPIFSVSGVLAKAVLTVEPGREVFEGDSVTLRCEFQGSSTGWTYHWYKNQQGNELLQTGSSGTGVIYTISAAALSDTGTYWCRPARGKPKFFPGYSQAIVLQVSAEQPKAVLTRTPDWSVLFPGEEVTLQCLIEGRPSAGLYIQYRAGDEELGQKLQCNSIGTTCTVEAKESHSGFYWCEDKAGHERSKSVDLKVSNASVILQSPPRPITEGDTLTLLCRARDTKGKRIVFEYYKNNETVESHSSTGVIIPAVMKKDAGLYKCFAYSKGRTLGGSEVEVSVRGKIFLRPACDSGWFS